MTKVIQMRYRLLEATTALATALAIGCGGADPPPPGNAPMLSRAATTTALIEHDIAPNDTDSAIQGLWLTKHYVSIDPAVNHRMNGLRGLDALLAEHVGGLARVGARPDHADVEPVA